MKRGEKSPRRKLVAELDRIFSLYIRARDNRDIGHCAFCPRPIEHNFHFITRGCYKTRWDELNCVGSCAGDNYRMEFNPHDYIKYFIDKHGLPAYEALILKSHGIAKYSTEDLEAMIAEYKGKLEEIK